MSDRHAIDPTKRRLLDHGVALILRNGYHGTGLAEVLTAAKVPKGSFYYYFASKEEFGAQAIEHYIAPFIVRLGEHMATPDRTGLAALTAYFREMIGELEANDFAGGCLLGNLMGEIGGASAPAREALKKAVDRYRDLLAKGLATAQSEGDVRRDRDAATLANLLVNAWQGALLRMKIERSAGPLREFVDEILLGYCRS